LAAEALDGREFGEAACGEPGDDAAVRRRLVTK
jgi:hypothetical protein